MASAVIGALRVIFGADTAAFEKGASKVERQLSATQKKLGKLSDKFVSTGKTLSLGLTAPLAAFGVASFNTASDAAELQSAFDQTFGAMSADMTKWAEETGNAMGRSTQEIEKAANTFGIFFNTAVPKDKAAEMSKTFAKLAEDLGSFYNVDTDTAIEKLRSGLTGEAEPLRDFGVFLTEAAVNSKALEMGIVGVGEKMTEQQKIQARYALIMEQTKNAQGDVARTSEGTANQMRKAQAAFEELQVTVGTKLLPVLTPLIERLGAAIEWFTNLPAPIQNVTMAIGAISAALGPALLAFGGVIKAFGTLLPLLTKLGPVIGIVRTAMMALLANPIILGAAAVIAGIYLAWKNWDKIEPIIRNLYTAVKTYISDKLGAVFNWLKGKLEAVGQWFYDLYDKVVGHSYIPDMVDRIGEHIRRLQGNMVDPVDMATDQVAGKFENMARNVQGTIQSLAQNIKSGDWLGVLDTILGAAGDFNIFGGGKNPIPTGNDYSALSSALGMIPGRAIGGHVNSGRPYRVGERGPEYFVPSSAGRIVPANDRRGPANDVNVNITMDTPLFNAVVDSRAAVKANETMTARDQRDAKRQGRQYRA